MASGPRLDKYADGVEAGSGKTVLLQGEPPPWAKEGGRREGDLGCSEGGAGSPQGEAVGWAPGGGSPHGGSERGLDLSEAR